ncbi:MAG: DNA adenine methylase [Phycisphaeraceae bacterium]
MSQSQLWLTTDDASFDAMEEDTAYLRTQIITYIGNKRSLLPFIDHAVKKIKSRLGRDKLSCVDLFSGSGIVARYLKQHSERLIANDLESYSYMVNACYLSNANTVDWGRVRHAVEHIHQEATDCPTPGFITELYAPEDEDAIKAGERVFYTRQNAIYLDSVCPRIKQADADLRPYLLGPLLAKASVHTNTSGVFKGFYKNSQSGIGQYGGSGGNALTRILGRIAMELPVLSRYESEVQVHQRDANELVSELDEVDLLYLDPPYNQHPYGSNYFMLNLLLTYERPKEMSRVSGIPTDWNRSAYNKKPKAYDAFAELIQATRAKFLLISFNSEGFIKKRQMLELLERFGNVEVLETQYNTFRGSRNLRERSVHVTEYLYLVERG